MPGTYQQIVVSKMAQRIQSFMAQSDSFLLVNPDITNSIYIGNDQGNQIIPVPPLGSITIGGSKHDTWISTNGGSFTVTAYLLPNGTQWTPSPAQVAQQINALGLATSANQGTQITHEANTENNTGNTNLFLGGNAAGALISAPGLSLSKDMLHANTGVTTEIAAMIATGSSAGSPGGAPILRKTDSLNFGSSATLTPGLGVILVNNVAVNQPGYEMLLNLWTNSGTQPTTPFATVIVNWFDASSGFSIEADIFVIACGQNSANSLLAYLSGPCKGDILNVQIINLDGAQNMQLSYAINANSHIYTWNRILQPTYASLAPNGFTNPNGTPAAGLLGIAGPSIAAGAISTRLLATWNGKAKLNFDAAGQSNTYLVTLQDPASLYSGTASGNFFVFNSSPAGSSFYGDVQMPNGPVLLTVKNTGAAAGAPTVSVFKEEY